MIRLLLLGAVVLFALTFLALNHNQEVTLQYFFGFQNSSTMVAVPLLVAFVMGLTVATILLVPAWMRGRLELRRKGKEIQELRTDLERIRRSVEQGASNTVGHRLPTDAGEHP